MNAYVLVVKTPEGGIETIFGHQDGGPFTSHEYATTQIDRAARLTLSDPSLVEVRHVHKLRDPL